MLGRKLALGVEVVLEVGLGGLALRRDVHGGVVVLGIVYIGNQE